MMAGKLQDKVAFITGASQGQGAAVARLFAEEGAKVILTDIADAAGEKVTAEIAGRGADAAYFHLDVAEETQWREVLNQVQKRHGALHVLINNAGIVSRKKIETMSSAEWHRVMNVNLTGAFYGMKYGAPMMRDSGGGSIVNVSSVGGLTAHYDAVYAASKWGLRGLTKTAAMEFVDWKIRVNSIHPGQLSDTSFMTNAVPGHNAASKIAIPMGRQGTPQETAKLMLFLACDDSSFITGAEIAIDGGYTAGGAVRMRAMLTKQFAEAEAAAAAEAAKSA
jgi:3alpha(or 20beta)-hydroxysteroid dehydrogenase